MSFCRGHGERSNPMFDEASDSSRGVSQCPLPPRVLAPAARYILHLTAVSVYNLQRSEILILPRGVS